MDITALLTGMSLSFVVGVALGYALKVAVKIALVVAGVFLIALFAMEHYGVVRVDWPGMELAYDGASSWLIAFGSVVLATAKAHLANAAALTAGIALGLRL